MAIRVAWRAISFRYIGMCLPGRVRRNTVLTDSPIMHLFNLSRVSIKYLSSSHNEPVKRVYDRIEKS